MNVYTVSEARQKLAAVLEEAQRKGAVRIKRRDGSEFEIAPVHRRRCQALREKRHMQERGGGRIASAYGHLTPAWRSASPLLRPIKSASMDAIGARTGRP